MADDETWMIVRGDETQVLRPCSFSRRFYLFLNISFKKNEWPKKSTVYF